jgi:hypothetical protein
VRRSPRDICRQQRDDGFVAPSSVDLRKSGVLDSLALLAVEAFEAVLLSPLPPLGSCSLIAPTSQDRTISAIRGREASDLFAIPARSTGWRASHQTGSFASSRAVFGIQLVSLVFPPPDEETGSLGA